MPWRCDNRNKQQTSKALAGNAEHVKQAERRRVVRMWGHWESLPQSQPLAFEPHQTPAPPLDALHLLDHPRGPCSPGQVPANSTQSRHRWTALKPGHPPFREYARQPPGYPRRKPCPTIRADPPAQARRTAGTHAIEQHRYRHRLACPCSPLLAIAPASRGTARAGDSLHHGGSGVSGKH